MRAKVWGIVVCLLLTAVLAGGRLAGHRPVRSGPAGAGRSAASSCSGCHAGQPEVQGRALPASGLTCLKSHVAANH